MKRTKIKTSNIVLIIVAVLAMTLVVGSVVMYLMNHDKVWEQDWYEMEQRGIWIDCQPPMLEHEQERCLEAQERSYPYIAY